MQAVTKITPDTEFYQNNLLSVYVCGGCGWGGTSQKKTKLLSCFTYCRLRFQERKGRKAVCLQFIQSSAVNGPCRCSLFSTLRQHKIEAGYKVLGITVCIPRGWGGVGGRKKRSEIAWRCHVAAVRRRRTESATCRIGRELLKMTVRLVFFFGQQH